jgi:hypothetical protein
MPIYKISSLKSHKSESTIQNSKNIEDKNGNLYYDEQKGWITTEPEPKEKKPKEKSSKKLSTKNKTEEPQNTIDQNYPSNDPMDTFLKNKANIKMTAIYHFSDKESSENPEQYKDELSTVVENEETILPELPPCECDNCQVKKTITKNPYFDDSNAEKQPEDLQRALVPLTNKTLVEECMCRTCVDHRRYPPKRHNNYQYDDSCSLCNQSECSFCCQSYCSLCDRSDYSICDCSEQPTNNKSIKPKPKIKNNLSNKVSQTKKISVKNQTVMKSISKRNNVNISNSKKQNQPISLVINVK